MTIAPHAQCAWQKRPHGRHYLPGGQNFCPGRAHDTISRCQRQGDHSPHIWAADRVYYSCPGFSSLLQADPMMAALDYVRAERDMLRDEVERLRAEATQLRLDLNKARLQVIAAIRG